MKKIFELLKEISEISAKCESSVVFSDFGGSSVEFYADESGSINFMSYSGKKRTKVFGSFEEAAAILERIKKELLERQSKFKTPIFIDKTEMFRDNLLKKKYSRLWHWTGGDTAEGAINWLNERNGGDGSVGYNYIVDEEKIYALVEPEDGYLQSSNLGQVTDNDTISVAFVGKGEYPSEQTIETLKFLTKALDEKYEITDDKDHHTIYPKKPDFPPEFWERLQNDLGLNGRSDG